LETICNAQMSHKQVRKFCALGKEESELLKMAMTVKIATGGRKQIAVYSKIKARWHREHKKAVALRLKLHP